MKIYLDGLLGFCEYCSGVLCLQVQLEGKPQSNPYRIKMKTQPLDQALLITVQNVPGLGEKKALALLNKFHSKLHSESVLC